MQIEVNVRNNKQVFGHLLSNIECLHLIFWHLNLTGDDVKSGCEAQDVFCSVYKHILLRLTVSSG